MLEMARRIAERADIFAARQVQRAPDRLARHAQQPVIGLLRRQNIQPPRGIGAATADTAEAMRKAAGKFIAPADVTPDVLEKAGEHAEDIDHIIASLEVVLANLKQANLLLDGKAWELLRKVNDQVNAQGKTNPEILTMFLPLTRYMKRFGRTTRRKTPTT